MQDDLSLLPENEPAEPRANVLIVDDLPANLLALEAILEELGQVLVRAASGAEALRLLLDRDFAVVLLDVRMDGMDGLETAKLIRGRERSRHTPIIFLTAHYGDHPTVEEAYALGAVDYLVKPLSPVILRTKVAAFVELFQKTEQVKRQAERLRRLERREFERKLSEGSLRLHEQREWLRVALASIGDAVIATDRQGHILFMNAVAQSLTGWPQEEAEGQALERAFAIFREGTREGVENPVARVLREGKVVGLANHTVLVARDGTERLIEDSAAPIRDEGGAVLGVILVFRDVTERRRAEKALEEQRREEAARLHFQTLFESVPGLFVVLKPDWTIAAVSDAYLAATMTKREEILGRGLFEVFPDNPDDPSATGVRNLRASLERVRRDRTADAMAVQKYDIRRPEAEGRGFEERYWSPVNSPVFGPDREIAYIIHRIEDVTEFVRSTGLPPHAVAEDPAARTSRMEAEIFLRGQQLQQANERLRAANDTLAAEIAVRRQREEALRHSEERFRLLVAGVQDYAIFMLNPEGRVVTWNAGAERIKGYKAEEIIGQHISRFYPREALDRDWPGEELRRAAADGRFEDEGWRLRKDGTPFWANVVFTALKDEAGRLRGFAKVTRDLTDRKRREEELRQLSRDLERRVEERTASLAASNEALQAENAERQRAEGALRETARHKDQFLAMLAHELRNPLAPIRTGLQVLKVAGADRQTTEKARSMMERQIGHMSRIVDDLLEVSRIQRGRINLRQERVDLGRLARVTTEDHRAGVEQAGLTVRLQVPDVPVWVEGDPTRLAQILSNLLQNAVKFTDRGGTVTVLVEAEADRRWVALAVRDTGIGIGPEMLPHLFETFAQADRSLERSKGGLGLGLALVKGLAELHGGEVHAASAGPGHGAEFVVRLPLQPEPAALAATPAAPAATPKRLRVLVVEDNRDSADSLRLLLELFGYDVAVAYSGPTGVETAVTWHPDVVLCDIGLPGLDGYGVAGELRQHPATAKARMIAVTGYGSEEDRRRSEEAGFERHLTKPVDPAMLTQLLETLAGAAGQQGA